MVVIIVNLYPLTPTINGSSRWSINNEYTGWKIPFQQNWNTAETIWKLWSWSITTSKVWVYTFKWLAFTIISWIMLFVLNITNTQKRTPDSLTYEWNILKRNEKQQATNQSLQLGFQFFSIAFWIVML